jgi:hypothetical protein
MSAAVIPEPIAQLQLQLDEIRSTRPRGKKLPDSVWQAAVELYALEQPPLDIQKGMHVWDRLCLSTVAHLRGLERVIDPSGGAEAWLWFDRRFS